MKYNCFRSLGMIGSNSNKKKRDKIKKHIRYTIESKNLNSAKIKNDEDKVDPIINDKLKILISCFVLKCHIIALFL